MMNMDEPWKEQAGKRDCLISVIMAIYNGEKYLTEQIQSVLEQSYQNIELILTDDGSTDRSVAIAEGFAQKDSRVKVRKNKKNLGVIQNFLTSLAMVRGAYVCFSDQDDVWHKDKLAVLVNLLEKDPQNMLACSDLAVCDGGLQVRFPSFWKVAGVWPPQGNLRGLAFLRNPLPGCSLMFRQEVKDCLLTMPAGGPFMHDHLAFVVAASLGRVVSTRKKLVFYRQHGANQIGAFYDSQINTERIIKELTEKVEFFRDSLPDDKRFKTEKVLSFCDCLRHAGILKRLSFLKYYLFLRNNRFLDQMLGVLECLAPKSYKTLKKMGKKEDIRIFFMRGLLSVWSFLVLFCFAGRFVLLKLNNFLR